MEVNEETANYYAVKGTMEWNRQPSSKFNDTELKVFFGASDETIERIRCEEKGIDVKSIDEARIQFGIAYEEIQELLRYYIDMPEDYYHLISIWILGTYLHSGFESFPYLFFNAMRGSAKTRTLRLISYLASKGEGNVETGINETTLYRSEKGATLVLDECETIGSKEKGELRLYLNSAYKKGAVVSRNQKVTTKGKEDYEVRKFEPYRPIVMANIWGMEEVLGDRCITLILEKSSDARFIKIIENYSTNPKIRSVRDVLDKVSVGLCMYVPKKNIIEGWNNYIKSTYIPTHTTLPTLTYNPTEKTMEFIEEELFLKIDKAGIDGRNLELFMPLLLTSRLLNEEIFMKTLEICKNLTSQKKTEEFAESRDIMFMEFVSTQAKYSIEQIFVSELTRLFREFVGQIDEEDKWITKEWVGRALKRLNLKTSQKRIARGVQVTLNISKAKEKLKMFKQGEKDE